MRQCEVAVIGAGPAGLAAAVAAYDRGARDVVILDREAHPGGVLNQCIHPGFGLHRLGQELTGPEYAAWDERAVRERSIPILTGTTVLSLSRDRVIKATGGQGIFHLKAKSVVLAMGCRERSRGALRIPGSRPAGIYSAGTAQKWMNCEGFSVGKRVVILGSGDIGLIMARRMALSGATVLEVCEVMPYSGGLRRNIVQCLEDFGIPLHLSTTVAQIHGRERLEGVTLVQVDSDRRPIPGTERYLSCDTLLLSCGLIPENELTHAAGILLEPKTGGATVNELGETEAEGIFACGNVLHVHDLVDYVSAEAERAGRGAADFALGKTEKMPRVETRAGEGIRYVIPQRIPQQGETTLFFRVASPVKNGAFVCRCGGRVLTRRPFLSAAPGEMEKLVLPAEGLREEGVEVFMEVKK
ncbi:MAG: FAD-dependent oxidoreductase [Clostridia bacterium]|nr:FAD-dependent oxidoreductase [Clostridia bacterium]